jgi:Domain of unknown function (DUF6265)
MFGIRQTLRKRIGMRQIRPAIRGIAITVLVVALTSSLPAHSRAGGGAQKQDIPPKAAPDSSTKTWLNFAWLEGRWQGNWGPRIVEQVWTAPRARTMAGIFREIENDKTLVIELFSVLETPEGIQYRSRHFTPSLVPWEQSGPVTLNLVSSDPSRIMFENPNGGKPKRATLTRMGPDTYVSRLELTPDQGDLQVVEITYHRQIASAGNAGRR